MAYIIAVHAIWIGPGLSFIDSLDINEWVVKKALRAKYRDSMDECIPCVQLC